MQAMPTRRTAHLITQQAGSELLIYDEEIHKACCLNDLAAAVWLSSDGSQTVASIATVVATALQRPVSEDLVLFTLEKLHADGLLLSHTVPEAHPIRTRRELVSKMGATAAMMLPVVTAIMAPKAAQAYSGCFNCDARLAPKQRAPRSGESPSDEGASNSSWDSWR